MFRKQPVLLFYVGLSCGLVKSCLAKLHVPTLNRNRLILVLRLHAPSAKYSFNETMSVSTTEKNDTDTCESSESDSQSVDNRQDGLKKDDKKSKTSSSSASLMRLTSVVKGDDIVFDRLTAEEKEIHQLHKDASDADLSTYTDPATGYSVFTQLHHIKRQKCCGSCCRHCPYSHVNVPVKSRTKMFNSAFFV